MELWQFLTISLFVSFVTKARSTPIAAILFANWAGNSAVAIVSEGQFNWIAMACVDYVSALLILMLCPNRWCVAIASLYAVEMVAHVAYGLSSQGPWPQYRYWDTLHCAAWAQAWLIFGWSALSGGKVVRCRFDFGRVLQPFHALSRRLGLHRKRDR